MKIKDLFSRIVITLVICCLFVVGTSSNVYAASPNFAADNAEGYVTIQGEVYYIEKTTSETGQVSVKVKDSSNIITESKTLGDNIQIQEKKEINGKEIVVSTKVLNTSEEEKTIVDETKTVHANAVKLTSSKQTTYGYAYYIYSDKSWFCYKNDTTYKKLTFKSSTESKLENFRASVNSARKYELKILSAGTTALLSVAITVATLGAAAIIAAVVTGGGTAALADYAVEYADALGDCKYYYGKL